MIRVCLAFCLGLLACTVEQMPRCSERFEPCLDRPQRFTESQEQCERLLFENCAHVRYWHADGLCQCLLMKEEQTK